MGKNNSNISFFHAFIIPQETLCTAWTDTCLTPLPLRRVELASGDLFFPARAGEVTTQGHVFRKGDRFAAVLDLQ